MKRILFPGQGAQLDPPAPAAGQHELDAVPLGIQGDAGVIAVGQEIIVADVADELLATGGFDLDSALVLVVDGRDFQILDSRAAETDGLEIHQHVPFARDFEGTGGAAFAPVAGDGFVVVEDRGDGRRCLGAIVMLGKEAVDGFGVFQFPFGIPRGAGDEPDLRGHGIGQPPGQAEQPIHVGRTGLPGLQGVGQVVVVGVVVFGTDKVAFHPRAAPVVALAVGGAGFECGGIKGDGGAGHIRRQRGHVMRRQAPAGNRDFDLRGIGFEVGVNSVKAASPLGPANRVFTFGKKTGQVIELGIVAGDLPGAGRNDLGIIGGKAVAIGNDIQVEPEGDFDAAAVGVVEDALKGDDALAEDLVIVQVLVVQGDVGAKVVIIEQIGGPEEVAVHIPAGHPAPAVAGAGGGKPGAGEAVLDLEIMKHFIMAVEVVVVDEQEIHPHPATWSSTNVQSSQE